MTNLLLNPGAEVNAAGAGTSNAATVTRTTARASHGTASFQVVTAGTTANEGVQMESSIGLGYTGVARSFYSAAAVSGDGTANIRTRVRYTDNSNVFSDAKPVTLTTSFQRLTANPVTLDPAKTVDALFLQVVTTTARVTTFYVDEGWLADYLPITAPQVPVLKVGSPHVGPLRVGKV